MCGVSVPLALAEGSRPSAYFFLWICLCNGRSLTLPASAVGCRSINHGDRFLGIASALLPLEGIEQSVSGALCRLFLRPDRWGQT